MQNFATKYYVELELQWTSWANLEISNVNLWKWSFAEYPAKTRANRYALAKSKHRTQEQQEWYRHNSLMESKKSTTFGKHDFLVTCTTKEKETTDHGEVSVEQRAVVAQKNADCYAELRLLDDKSLSLIRHNAANDGRKPLQILREHYSGIHKSWIINLYATLTVRHGQQQFCWHKLRGPMLKSF